jgi:hypothetical protein
VLLARRLSLHNRQMRHVISALLGLLIALVAPAPRGAAQSPSDPLQAEVAKWTARLEAETRTDDFWTQIKPGAQTALKDATAALAAGRRWLALERLASARANLSAAAYLFGRPEDVRTDVPAFEREWTRMAATLRLGGSTPTDAASMASIRPAVVRALAEAAADQVRIYYDASVEYGRNTELRFGLTYLGIAQAQQEFVALARTLSSTATPQGPALRSIASEIDALQGELLSAYRPPASIDRHAEFIVVSAALKEARALDAAGLRHGALQRYVAASQRVAMLQQAGGLPAVPDLQEKLKAAAAKLGGAVDHSIGQLFVERAQAALDAGTAAPAAAIVDRAIPAYLAALGAPAPRAPAATPAVTVTLVRWPFT